MNITTLVFGMILAATNLSSIEVQKALSPFVERGEIAGVISVLSDADYNETWDLFGYADAENKKPMRPDSVFSIFSMTKTFTGIAMMCAIDDGVISLDDPVSKFLPEYDRVAFADGRKPKRAITVRDVTSHMDGMRQEYGLIDFDIPPRASAAWYAARPMQFEPGEKFAYGTQRFTVAAACIEVATGKEFYSFLKERVLDPLGMVDTVYEPTPDQIARHVKAYTTTGGLFKVGNDMCCQQLVFPKKRKLEPGCGSGLYSTAADMIRFSQMLAHHGQYKGKTIVTRETFDNIFAVIQVPPEDKEHPYTCGAWLYGDWIGHEGAMRTDQRANLRTGESRVFFIQTENAAGKAFFDAKIAWHKACDIYQKSEIPFQDELVKTHENDNNPNKKNYLK